MRGSVRCGTVTQTNQYTPKERRKKNTTRGSGRTVDVAVPGFQVRLRWACSPVELVPRGRAKVATHRHGHGSKQSRCAHHLNLMGAVTNEKGKTLCLMYVQCTVKGRSCVYRRFIHVDPETRSSKGIYLGGGRRKKQIRKTTPFSSLYWRGVCVCASYNDAQQVRQCISWACGHIYLD